MFEWEGSKGKEGETETRRIVEPSKESSQQKSIENNFRVFKHFQIVLNWLSLPLSVLPQPQKNLSSSTLGGSSCFLSSAKILQLFIFSLAFKNEKLRCEPYLKS
jgi:hypothetical protein